MTKPVLLPILGMFIINITNAQIQGSIKNYSNQTLHLYQCLGDSLVLVDSTRANAKGEFEFKESRISSTSQSYPWALYKVNLQRNQWFYVLYGNEPVAIKTVYVPSPFYNIATDSLQVVQSAENKKLYEFTRLNELLKIANTWLLEMERLYPINDPFHPTIVKEYEARQNRLHEFVKKNSLHRQTTSPAGLITLAYYTPEVPDWKEPDTWRDSIMAAHYFDYFDPAHPFYLMTDILPGTLDKYLKMRINKRDAYGQPVQDPNLLIQAAKDFLDKTRSTDANFRFCLHYLLKIADKEHKDDLFLVLYDTYLQTQEGDCGSQHDEWAWAREKANLLRGVKIGSTAPDFVIEDGKLNLHSIQSDYTLIIFWSSWCPHCTEEIPKIKTYTDALTEEFKKHKNTLSIVAVSLDTDKESWKNYVTQQNLFNWFNYSELKGWKSKVVKRYNVYATPSMFVLDKDKKIIAKPDSYDELKREFAKIKIP